jgi:hypothetical protein
VLVAIVLGFGAGWLYRGDLPTIAGLSAGANKCQDRPDGSRLCWIPVWEERLPPGKGAMSDDPILAELARLEAECEP